MQGNLSKKTKERTLYIYSTREPNLSFRLSPNRKKNSFSSKIFAWSITTVRIVSLCYFLTLFFSYFAVFFISFLLFFVLWKTIPKSEDSFRVSCKAFYGQGTRIGSDCQSIKTRFLGTDIKATDRLKQIFFFTELGFLR